MMQKKILPYKETQLHYKIIGEGNTIVLLHGFGEDSTIWDHFIKSLSENYQLIVPDIPGSGSSALLNGAHVGMEDYAATIFAILKHENIKKCSMVVLAAMPVPVTSLYLDSAAVEASVATAEPEVMEAVSGPAVSPWNVIRLNVVPSQ